MLWLYAYHHAISGYNDALITSITTWQDCADQCLTYTGGSFTPPCKSFDFVVIGTDECNLAQNNDQHNADYIEHTNFEYGEHCIGKHVHFLDFVNPADF